MNDRDRLIKRVLDIMLSAIGLILFGLFIIITIIISRIDTKLSGIFKQKRIGKEGAVFFVYKLRTMKNIEGVITSVSTSKDPRITNIGRLFRRTKVDELPQLINVFLGDMSFVGPRPDVSGFADTLEGDDRIILSVKPGITGPASIFFKNEEKILAEQTNPEKYNREIIWPKKIEINKKYIKNYKFINDIKYIVKTII